VINGKSVTINGVAFPTGNATLTMAIAWSGQITGMEMKISTCMSGDPQERGK
jgi:hypothetical protein